MIAGNVHVPDPSCTCDGCTGAHEALATMIDTAAIARRYEATDVWSDGYKSGVHDARGERASAVSSAFAVGIIVGGLAVAAIGFLLLKGVT